MSSAEQVSSTRYLDGPRIDAYGRKVATIEYIVNIRALPMKRVVSELINDALRIQDIDEQWRGPVRSEPQR